MFDCSPAPFGSATISVVKLTIRSFVSSFPHFFLLFSPLSNPASATSSAKQSFVPDERSTETPCTEATATAAASTAATVSVSVQQPLPYIEREKANVAGCLPQLVNLVRSP